MVLTRVTYGLRSSWFNSGQPLIRLVELLKERYPLAYKVVMRHFFRDDKLAGADTVEEAIEIVAQLTAALSEGGFDLAKWRSNYPEVLGASRKQECEAIVALNAGDSENSVLGLLWNSETDTFGFRVNIRQLPDRITKCMIASENARIYPSVSDRGEKLLLGQSHLF